MKVLSELGISLDRISTREELEEVWNLLTDPYAPENDGVSIAHAISEPRLIDWRAELRRVGAQVDTADNALGNLADNEDEEQPSQSREKNLVELLLQMNKPTN